MAFTPSPPPSEPGHSTNPLLKVFNVYTPAEKRNMALYIAGICMYKFGLETMNTCMYNLFLRQGTGAYPNLLWTVLQSLNYAAQCVGSLAVAPMVSRFPANRVQGASILAFGLTAAIIPIMEVATGGSRKVPGNWNPNILFLLFPVCGFFYGIVELLRRIIPYNIVGGNDLKLRRMDAMVHVFYEIFGTSGALLSVFWIQYFNFAYAFWVLIVCFGLSFVFWFFAVRLSGPDRAKEDLSSELGKKAELKAVQEAEDELIGKELAAEGIEAFPLTKSMRQGSAQGILKAIGRSFHSFFISVYRGGALVFGNRSLIWLIPCYVLPLVLHRYLENTLFPFYAKFVLKVPAQAQYLVGGSNAGELLGAFIVFILAKLVPSPIPWIRIDALMLLFVWVFAYVYPIGAMIDTAFVWRLFPAAMLISSGWAAGDVSLVAAIQSTLSTYKPKGNAIYSPLAAVMAFLYSAYIVLFPILVYVMGFAMDHFNAQKRPEHAVVWVGGVFFTISMVIIIISTFIVKGSFAWNPKLQMTLDGKDFESVTGPEKKEDLTDYLKTKADPSINRAGKKKVRIQGTRQRRVRRNQRPPAY